MIWMQKWKAKTPKCMQKINIIGRPSKIKHNKPLAIQDKTNDADYLR
jgi:hypothetical protein